MAVAVPAWSTNLGHLPSENDPSAPEAARLRGAFTRAVVEAATARAGPASWPSAVRCIATVGPKGCRAWILVAREGPDAVAWSCPSCGEQGVVTGFAGSASDMSIHGARDKEVTWGFAEDEYEILRLATIGRNELRRVVVRASPHAEIPGLLLVRATIDELDEVYTLVEELEGRTRSRKKLEILTGLRFSLSTAMDGF